MVEMTDPPTRVLVAVCTRRRPMMLRRCLLSIADQLLPPGFEVEILVVENDAEPGLRSVGEEVGALGAGGGKVSAADAGPEAPTAAGCPAVERGGLHTRRDAGGGAKDRPHRPFRFQRRSRRRMASARSRRPTFSSGQT